MNPGSSRGHSDSDQSRVVQGSFRHRFERSHSVAIWEPSRGPPEDIPAGLIPGSFRQELFRTRFDRDHSGAFLVSRRSREQSLARTQSLAEVSSD